jgi:HPt (histidine-containing phosphotransfer) domain-containing protein
MTQAPSTPTPAEFEARYQSLRRRFLERSEGDLPLIEAAVSDPDSVDRGELREKVHKMAGAAGTFGFAELSRVAGEADDALMAEWASFADEIAALAQELRRTLDDAGA